MNTAYLSNRRKRFHYRERPTAEPSTVQVQRPFHYQRRSYEDWVWHAYQGPNDPIKHGTLPPRSWLLASQFNSVQFQFFITISPSLQVTTPQLKDMVKRFIEDSVRQWKTMHRVDLRIGYVVGYETKDSQGLHDPHIHMAFTSRPRVNAEFMERRWHKIVGPSPGSVDVRAILPTDFKSLTVHSADVVKYCLKGANDSSDIAWDWDFSPDIESFRPRTNARARRDAVRAMTEKFKKAAQLKQHSSQ